MFLTRKLLILLALVSSALDISCNRGEGPGGTGTIEGTVYKVLHPDDNYNLETDTVLAAKEDVFWVYGTQSFYGEDEIPSVVSKTISVSETDQIYWFSDTFKINVKP